MRERDLIDVLAYHFWSVHPKDIPIDPNMPENYPGGKRAWYYSEGIRDYIKLES